MTARASDLRAAEPHARGDEDPAGRASCSRELGAYSLLVAEKRRSPQDEWRTPNCTRVCLIEEPSVATYRRYGSIDKFNSLNTTR